MTAIDRILLVLFGCVVLSSLTAPALQARQVDVYVVYGGGDRAAKNELVAALPDGLSVKSYNSNLLALADYSGKQKVLSKLETASVVVILSEAPLEYLEGRLSNADLLIVSSVSSALTSEGRTIHVVSSGTNVSSLGSGVTTLNVASEADLDPARVQEADVILVNESAVAMSSSVAVIVQRILGN